MDMPMESVKKLAPMNKVAVRRVHSSHLEKTGAFEPIFRLQTTDCPDLTL